MLLLESDLQWGEMSNLHECRTLAIQDRVVDFGIIDADLVRCNTNDWPYRNQHNAVYLV